VSIELAVVLVFVVALVIIAIGSRKSTLEDLPWLSGEAVRLEEGPVTVTQGARGRRPTRFVRCVVRVTDQRLIVAQKVMLSSKRALRVVVTLTDAESMAGEASLDRGFLQVTVGRSLLLRQLERGTAALELPMRGGLLLVEQNLTIPVADLGAWREALTA